MIHANEALLAVMLENCEPGTQMAGAYVDLDGTARIELVERLETGWKNLTINDALTTSIDMAAQFDDLCVTRLPGATP